MNEKTAILIDLRMLTEYRAKPAGPWLRNDDGQFLRLYLSESQALVVGLHADVGSVAVYSFSKEFAV